jgi:hypothetical protein
MVKVGRLPKKGPNSPFSAGNRTILARTCSRCGELADGDSFPLLNAGQKNQARRKVCHNCQNLQKKRDRDERGIGLPPRTRPSEPLQTSKYQQWTTKDEKYLREAYEEGYSYEDIGLALGRSANAVFLRRVRLGLPRLRKSHRVEKPWKIQ